MTASKTCARWLLLALLAAPAAALGQDRDPGAAPGDDIPDTQAREQHEDSRKAKRGYELQLQLYFFIPARTQGVLAAGGASADVNVTFEDLWKNTKVGGLAARAEKWFENGMGGVIDGYYSRIEVEESNSTTIPIPGQPTLAGAVEAELRLSYLDLMPAFRPLDLELGDNLRLQVDAMGGMRIADLKQEISFAVNSRRRELGDSHNWVELAFGARVALWIGPFAISTRADLSGFGIGSASDLTWNWVTQVTWRPVDVFAIDLGYHVLDIDYSRGSGRDRIEADVTMHGPQLSFNVFF